MCTVCLFIYYSINNLLIEWLSLTDVFLWTVVLFSLLNIDADDNLGGGTCGNGGGGGDDGAANRLIIDAWPLSFILKYFDDDDAIIGIFFFFYGQKCDLIRN